MATPDPPPPPWGSLSADLLRECFVFLPDAASRAAARLTCRHWRQAGDEGAQIWQRMVRRRPADTSAPPPTISELGGLLRRQRAHLRRLQLEAGSVSVYESDGSLPGQHAAAVALSCVLEDACGEGSGLTAVVLAAKGLPRDFFDVLPGAAAQLTSLCIKPLSRHGISLRWDELLRSPALGAQLASLSLSADLRMTGPVAALSALTALTALKLATAGAPQLPPDLSAALLALPATAPLQRLDLGGVRLDGLPALGGGPLEEDEDDDDDPHPLGLLPCSDDEGEAGGGGGGGGSSDEGDWSDDDGGPFLLGPASDEEEAPPPMAPDAAELAAPDLQHLWLDAGQLIEPGMQQLWLGGEGPIEPPLPPLEDGSSGSFGVLPDGWSDDDGGPLLLDPASEEEGAHDEGPPPLVPIAAGAAGLDMQQPWLHVDELFGPPPPLEEDFSPWNSDEDEEEGEEEDEGGEEGEEEEEGEEGGEGSLGSRLAASWRHLQHLGLRDVSIAPSLQRALPSLPCLTSLHVAPRENGRSMVEVAQLCRGLQELTFGRLSLQELPSLRVGALPQLTRLRIENSHNLRRLDPSWCSLTGLLSFELESCERLRRLPPELSALTGLQQLRISHQRLEQLPQVVAGLSQLTRLSISACSLAELPAGPYLRELWELTLSFNSLDCVPAVLAHPGRGPTALRSLDLSSNYSHTLCMRDIEVLRRLTSLTTLDLRRQYPLATSEGEPGGEHAAALLAELRAALPRCEVLA